MDSLNSYERRGPASPSSTPPLSQKPSKQEVPSPSQADEKEGGERNGGFFALSDDGFNDLDGTRG